MVSQTRSAVPTEPRITLQKFSRTRVGILIVQNIGFTLPKSFFAQLGVGNADRFDHCHDNVPFGGDLGWAPVGGGWDEDSCLGDSGLAGIAVS
jgi:hypothetical protein